MTLSVIAPDGSVEAKFGCATGKVPGHKQRRGDMRTPLYCVLNILFHLCAFTASSASPGVITTTVPTVTIRASESAFSFARRMHPSLARVPIDAGSWVPC